MTDNRNTDIDIFAPPAPVAREEKAIALKRELEDLRVQLHPMIESAPIGDEDLQYLEKEDWCRRWKALTDSLTKVVYASRDIQLDVHLTIAEREDGTSGNEIYNTLHRQVSAVKGRVAAQVEQVTKTKRQAEKDRQDQEQKTRREAEAGAQKEKNTDEVGNDLQDDTQEHAAQEDDVQTHDTHEQELTNSEKGAQASVQEEPVLKRSSRLYSAKKNTQRDQSDDDVEVLSMSHQTAEPVGPKKKVPRMTVSKPGGVRKLGPYEIQCDKCATAGRTCYRLDIGAVCWDCRRLKIACSHASDKNKTKQKPSPPPNPSPAPITTTTSATKPKPTPVARASTAAKAGPAPKTTPVPEPKGKDEGTPTVACAAPRMTPGPLTNQRPYVEIKSKRKRQVASIEEELSESERDDEDEDAYIAGRLNGLRTYISMFETAFGALKKEVTEIDSYLVRKRRRIRH